MAAADYDAGLPNQWLGREDDLVAHPRTIPPVPKLNREAGD
jgi:hypothetical protein